MNHIPSPDTSDSGIERLIQAKGLTAPRVTPDDLKANITAEIYFTGHEAAEGARAAHGGYPFIVRHTDAALEPSLRLMTFCVLVLRNGFTVTGEIACASPENFNAEIGRQIARANAVEKIWPLMGYALKEQLHKDKV